MKQKPRKKLKINKTTISNFEIVDQKLVGGYCTQPTCYQLTCAEQTCTVKQSCCVMTTCEWGSTCDGPIGGCVN